MLAAGCHEYDHYHEPSTSVSFEVHTYSGGGTHIIDPYVNDGVFEITWDFRHLHSPTLMSISLGQASFPTNDDILMAERYYDIYSDDFDVTGWQAYQYDSHNELWRLDEHDRLDFIADLTHRFPYGETFYIHFEACQDSGNAIASRNPFYSGNNYDSASGQVYFRIFPVPYSSSALRSFPRNSHSCLQSRVFLPYSLTRLR